MSRYDAIVVNTEYPGLNPVQFGYEDCEPGHFYGPAVRTCYLIHCVFSGCGVFERDGIRHPVGAGDLFIIRPFEETFYQADELHPWSYSWIGFDAAGLPCPLDEPVIHAPGAVLIFDEMRRCERYEGGRSAFLSGKLWELFGLLLERERHDADYVEKAVSMMRSEYATGIGILEIAARLNLDRSYFSSLFRERMGVSPRDYLHTLRLEQAAELMLHHGQSPTTAAASIGYTDLYQFSRAFKKHFGLSPRAYCRAHQETQS